MVKPYHQIAGEHLPKEALPTTKVPHHSIGPPPDVLGDLFEGLLGPALAIFAVEGVVEVPLRRVFL